jgi:hypothetical protein
MVKPSSSAAAETTQLSIHTSGEQSRIGKDEMNLVEFPWFTMWKHESSETVIHEEWVVDNADGRPMQCSWRVTGDPELGLPNANALRLFLVLLELSREAGWPQTVQFTHYELLKRLGWARSKTYYKMLEDAFTRLKTVTINADNCWREPAVGVLRRNVKCNIIDDVDIFIQSRDNKRMVLAQGTSLPLSSFKWSDRVHNSIKAGHLATYDLEFALSLKSDVALSLYRLLSKKMYQSRVFEMDLATFYHRHLGMRPCKFPSKMKERLKQGHDELIERGFLRSVSYAIAKGTGRDKIVYERNVGNPELQITETGNEQLGRGEDEIAKPDLLQRMVALGVDAKKAESTLQEYDSAEIELQLDCLPDRHAADPAAMLLAALRGKWSVPKTYEKRVQQQQAAQAAVERQQREKAEKVAVTQAKQQETQRLTAFYENLSSASRAIVDKRVEIELGEAFYIQNIKRHSQPWKAALLEVLRDEVFRESLMERTLLPAQNVHLVGETIDSEISEREPEDEEIDFPAGEAQLSIFPNLSIYVEELQARIAGGANPQELDGLQQQVAPLLELEEWQEVKRLALTCSG